MGESTTTEVINNAASYLIKRVKDRHKHHISCGKCLKKMTEGDISEVMIRHHKVNHNDRYRISNKLVKSLSCTCLAESIEIQEGKKSPLVSSPDSNRRIHRREGVAERNGSERRLTKVAVKEMTRSKSCDFVCR